MLVLGDLGVNDAGTLRPMNALVLAGQLETVTKASDLRTRTLGNLSGYPPPGNSNAERRRYLALSILTERLLVFILHGNNHDFMTVVFKITLTFWVSFTRLSDSVTSRGSNELVYEPPLGLLPAI